MNKQEFKELYHNCLASDFALKVDKNNKIIAYMALAKVVNKLIAQEWLVSKEKVIAQNQKQMSYFSLEFLLGKMLANNLHNLGLYEIASEALKEDNIVLEELLDIEKDPGLGNGGLGRLAACFMDSLAYLKYPSNGNTIRYKYGLFKQIIKNKKQCEEPDQWLSYGNPWEVYRPDKAVIVNFYGKVNISLNEKGELSFKHEDAIKVKAVPYEMPIIGANNQYVNTLRMWSAEPVSDFGAGDMQAYLADIEKLCLNVYPDDSNYEGKILRMKQEYFFVAAGLKYLLNEHKIQYGTLDNLADKLVIQLNDTHPALAIVELMRLLLDEEGYSWIRAENIVKKVFAYTNHTVMAEALEKWPIEYFKRLFPRLFMIIEEMDRRYREEVNSLGLPLDYYLRTAIIGHYHLRMANLSVLGSFKVNGVASLHTSILKQDLFKDYYQLNPDKFHNKTNGISQRRFFLYANPQLKCLLEDKLQIDLLKDFKSLTKLMYYVDEPELKKAFLKVKYQCKENLAHYLKKNYQLDFDCDSLLFVHAKRLHAYKRQLLAIFYIMHLYFRFLDDESFTLPKTTFIFSGKAASSYYFAKEVIRLIIAVSDKIKQFKKMSEVVKVLFIPNYAVSISEKLVPAADVSQQISLAGKEASGTGNMKFMMNGALTLGTYDGANIEIAQSVGSDNIFIFGKREEEIAQLKEKYRCLDYYQNDKRLKRIIDSLLDDTFAQGAENFKAIANEFLLHNDEYFLLADFASYVEQIEKVYSTYQDKDLWAKKCLINIANSPYFSSDRTIEEYVNDVWHLQQVK